MKIAIAGVPGKHRSYIAALAGVGLEAAVLDGPADMSAFSGLLLPGGGDIDPALFGQEDRGSRDIDRALDEMQLVLTDAFVRAGKPVMGICKGLQILNVYFGGDVIQHLAAAGTHRGDDRDVVHRCVSLPGTVTDRLYGRRYAVNSFHHQCVGRMGKGFFAASFAEDGTVESAAHESLPVFGVQWHPERACFAKARPDTVDGAEIFRYFLSLL